MPSVEKLSIALPPGMANLLREAVASGEYASASEAIRDALRAWTRKRRLETLEVNELRRLVQEGMDSGPAVDADQVLSKLESKYASRRKNAKK
jgi:antitoxin ParD1/3/4